MRCSNCKKEIEDSFTSNDNKQICKECLEKEIYKYRKRVIKNERRVSKIRNGERNGRSSE